MNKKLEGTQKIVVGSSVYFYNGWMFSNGVVLEVETVNKSNAQRYPASFRSGQKVYTIKSNLNGSVYSPICRANILWLTA